VQAKIKQHFEKLKRNQTDNFYIPYTVPYKNNVAFFGHAIAEQHVILL